MEKIEDKFLRYVSVNTESNPDSDTYPSSACQLELLNMLVEELSEIGLEDVDIDANGYVMATIPATDNNPNTPTIGFIAHVDTSPDLSGKNVKARIIEYKGGDITLNKELGIVMKESEFPVMKEFINEKIIVTDGTTLLGADDKAGIAEIVSAAEYLISNKDIKHGRIRIGFTPDEEIGRGVDRFDVEKFGAKYAYTMDGGYEGELEYENFNAAGAKVIINGNNIHPGYAKGKMINSLLVAQEFNQLIPNELPENTEGYEGFYHLYKLNGSAEKALAEYIIRDHDRNLFEERKNIMESAAKKINSKYGKEIITLEINDQYYNMREMIEPHMEIINTAKKAMELSVVKPLIRPIRGGTDGARLSYMGLPCPNIFAGGINFHSKYEFVSIKSMERARDVIINIAKLFAKQY